MQWIHVYTRTGDHRKIRTHIPQPLNKYVMDHTVSLISDLPDEAHMVVHRTSGKIKAEHNLFASKLGLGGCVVLPEAELYFQETIYEKFQAGESVVIVDEICRKADVYG